MLRGAASILLEEPYRAELFEAALDMYRPTLVLAQPKVIADFLVADLPKNRIRSARVWLSAGETLSPSLYETWAKMYEVPLFDVLGATELGHVFIANTDLKSWPGSAGQVLPGFEARILDADGYEAPVGQRGELTARGVGMTKQYINDAKRCADLTETGWIHTGDLASRSADGHYTIYGRVDDLIKVGCGEWIMPVEFEQIINADADVAESAVIGRRSAAGLTEACAFVVLKSPNVDKSKVAQRLLAAVQASYPDQPHKRLEAIEYIERMPRTINGKIARQALRMSGLE
jgi:acyl-coenzyme A synthetase/AMP-(fatty) acid ligase